MASSNDGPVCVISGCESKAERSITAKKVLESGLSLKEGSGRKAALCREHYREFKKATKKDRVLETLGR